MLGAAQESQGPGGHGVVQTVAEGPHHLEDASRDVLGGRVHQGLQVPKGEGVEPLLGIILVKGGEAAVFRLHAQTPVDAPLQGRLVPGRIRQAILEGHQDHGAVIDVGIPVVVKLEGPAPAGSPGI